MFQVTDQALSQWLSASGVEQIKPGHREAQADSPRHPAGTATPHDF